MGEHAAAKVDLHTESRAKEADTPKEASHHERQNNKYHGAADLVQKKCHVEGAQNAVHLHNAIVEAIDYHTVQLRNDKLHKVYHNQRRDTKQQRGQVFQIVSVNVFSEYHGEPPFLFSQLLYYNTPPRPLSTGKTKKSAFLTAG